ncbi:hypothetical protein ARMSODRAFT_964256 [Armillaria solidipes]|uniref:Uncharacterized protein n=1 Tax=Armillaria solidipes TaxID=1076256 RepID=A0A2H3AZY4_9AGAR|nr:hypothetical protein ARMSODRAFT_964256 [Armillaria solidipes]
MSSLLTVCSPDADDSFEVHWRWNSNAFPSSSVRFQRQETVKSNSFRPGRPRQSSDAQRYIPHHVNPGETTHQRASSGRHHLAALRRITAKQLHVWIPFQSSA